MKRLYQCASHSLLTRFCILKLILTAKHSPLHFHLEVRFVVAVHNVAAVW
jgi:hypothetical protein